MYLNLEQAFDGPVDLSSRFEVPADSLGRPEVLSLEGVDFNGRLQRVEGRFVLRGTLRMSGEVSCGRCLVPVPFSRLAEVAWVFVPSHQRKAAESDELELSGTDLDVVFYDALEIPFDPFVEEQLQLEIPMKVLCRDDCRGLCPQCGADRNSAACACASAADDRWAALGSVLPDRS